MQIAMSCALALMSWREFKFLHGDFTGSGFVWLPSDQTDNVPETILLRNQLAENLRPEALFSLSGSKLTGPFIQYIGWFYRAHAVVVAPRGLVLTS
jgi:hypothetical protein